MLCSVAKTQRCRSLASSRHPAVAVGLRGPKLKRGDNPPRRRLTGVLIGRKWGHRDFRRV